MSEKDKAAAGCETWTDFHEMLKEAHLWAQGPHEKSNWLMDRVLVGGWPFRLPKGRGSQGESQEEGLAKLSSILEAGVLTFVSLTQKDEIRGKQYCYSSFRALAEAKHAELLGVPRRRARRGGRELRFLQCPMVDGGTCSDELVMQLLQQLLLELRSGRRIYVHCYGGHGRVSADEAVAIFNDLHSFRLECGVGGPGQFPHSDAQLQQVHRIAEHRKRFEALLPAD
ncbi:unnamed protein product [Effrenium voratum]|uniref:Tyrosine specific protein phosphatases domain-containing protein n=1 Tax=Effrenium voratum TaxID=2562239 RepID=A0AA36N4R4_9DINO|nr:unnamed protein product [Effrenium voratum]